MATSCPSYPDSKNPKSFEDGLEFQDFVADALCRELGLAISNFSSRRFQYTVGENKQGIEIKLDKRMADTGNVSIEVGEKSRADNPRYVPSGILREDNSWLYVQGCKELLFIFSKKRLVDLYNSKRYRVDELPTIRRFLMPMADAMRHAEKVLDFRDSEVPPDNLPA